MLWLSGICNARAVWHVQCTCTCCLACAVHVLSGICSARAVSHVQCTCCLTCAMHSLQKSCMLSWLQLLYTALLPYPQVHWYCKHHQQGAIVRAATSPCSSSISINISSCSTEGTAAQCLPTIRMQGAAAGDVPCRRVAWSNLTAQAHTLAASSLRTSASSFFSAAIWGLRDGSSSCSSAGCSCSLSSSPYQMRPSIWCFQPAVTGDMTDPCSPGRSLAAAALFTG